MERDGEVLGVVEQGAMERGAGAKQLVEPVRRDAEASVEGQRYKVNGQRYKATVED